METLTGAAMMDLLHRARAGRLVTLDRDVDETYVVPINFVYSSGSVYFFTEGGRKLKVLRQRPSGVGFQLDGSDGQMAWSVFTRGDFEPVKRPAERVQAMGQMLRKYGQQAVAPLWGRARGDVAAFLKSLSEAEVGALRVTFMSGRRWA